MKIKNPSLAPLKKVINPFYQASARWYLQDSGSGYWTITQIGLTGGWYLEFKIYCPDSVSRGYHLPITGSASSIQINDTDNASANDIILSRLGTATWSGAMPSDRSVDHTLRFVGNASNSEIELFVNGVSQGVQDNGAGVLQVSACGYLTDNGVRVYNVDVNGANYYAVDDGSGTTVTDSVGSYNGSFAATSTGLSWVEL